MSEQRDDELDEEEAPGPQRDADETTQADAGLTGGEGPPDDDGERVGNEEDD
jgi:hypothetical protein